MNDQPTAGVGPITACLWEKEAAEYWQCCDTMSNKRGIISGLLQSNKVSSSLYNDLLVFCGEKVVISPSIF